MPTNGLIVRTKLYRPQVTAGTVLRPRLLDLLDSGADRPLTLVSAPAGYGKSVVVSQWLEERGTQAAWVSLDEEDGDLRTFLAYVLAALESTVPGSCRGTATLLDAPELPPVTTICEHLSRDMDTLDTSCVLVLDDYHRLDITSPVHEILDHLLDHAASTLRLVMISRRDPPLELARVRASGNLAELRLQDLRFTGSETTAFLVEAAQHSVGESALNNLQKEMEGWAVGLRLVTLALRHAEDPDAFLQGIHGGLALTREYLIREVLATLSDDIRRFLLTSSILDRFCAELLEAVVGPSGDGATGPDTQAFLLSLQDNNLFTIPLDDQGHWFRYHHLFQDLLTTELMRAEGPDVVAELNARASAWFEAAGSIGEALKYALAAGDIECAVRLVESNRVAAVNADRWYVLGKWLELLPNEQRMSRPELLMARAWYLLHHSRFDAVFPLLETVESMLVDDPLHDGLRGEVALFRGYILFFLGDGSTGLPHLGVARRLLPETFSEARAQTEVISALSKQMVGLPDEGLGDLDVLLDGYDSPDDLFKTRILVTQVMVQYIAGDTAASELANLQLREVSDRGGFTYAGAWSSYLQGLIHLQRFELEEAIDHLGHSVAQRFQHFKRAAVDSMVGLMLCQHALGQVDEARATLQKLHDYVVVLDDPVLWVLVGAADARLAALRGVPDSVATWLAQGEPPPTGAMLWWFGVPAVTRCRVQLASGSAIHLAEATANLEKLAAESEGQHNICRLVGILALWTLGLARLGRQEESQAALKRAVELARPGGLIYPFVETGPSLGTELNKLAVSRDSKAFLERIKQTLSDTGEKAKPAAITNGPLEELTARERDVLSHLADRLQDKEIASRLGLSVHTVRHHLKQIYQKLDVHDRDQAVKCAIDLGQLGNGPPD